ncbi:MAG: phage portal protein [Deltaproteobacteria bacterium]|nr:phage portal protein [Deltaproteobacteria bacterium]
MSKRAAVKLNALDRAIGFFSPQRGLQRASARQGLTFMAGGVSRTAASKKGTLSNYFVKRLNRFTEANERTVITDRAADLIANNPHAASIVDTTSLDTVGGSGLTPQAAPNYKALGITEDEADLIAEQSEWAFKLWSREADAEGVDHFADIQYQSIRGFLGAGEYLNLPVQITDDPTRNFSFALQVLDNRRLRTPREFMNDDDVRDGIRLDGLGRRKIYYIADPDDGKLTTNLSSKSFRKIKAKIGHQPGVFHGFDKKDAEQIRGISILAPMLKLFKDYDDYMDFHVVGEILAASFPVFIETPLGEDPSQYAGDVAEAVTAGGSKAYKEYAPGQVTYGGVGQKPHILKSDRSSGSFPVFIETVLRAIGAGAGQPYEKVAKDFSKTNYSSARAALLESWRVAYRYQSWLENHFCQPVWEIVFEEAWLRGMITLPKGAPDFYDARQAYTNAKWTPPRRGHIDPVKEVTAGRESLDNHMTTMADWYAEQGQDWKDALKQIAREEAEMKRLGISPTESKSRLDASELAMQKD